jgi:hypothetical protein
MVGHVWYQRTAEISIPPITIGSSVTELATATALQWGDATDGTLAGHGGRIYGQLVYGAQLLGAAYSTDNATTHFISGVDLPVTGDFRGYFRVGTLDQRFVAGYMSHIPSEWQPLLGGDVLTGGCCNPGQGSATSFGPAAFVLQPNSLGQSSPTPVAPLVYYSAIHPTLGVWNNTSVVNLAYNMMSEVTGVAFPPATRSVLFFGRTGTGIPCYGNGTDDPALDRQPWPIGVPGAMYCYDPNEVNGGFGPHAWPYSYQVWAYDAQEFVNVKSGVKNPWDVTPYAIWTFDLPFQDSQRHIQGAALDPATGRIYLAQFGGEPNGVPLIHVFKIRASAAPPPPAAPKNVRVIS